MAKLNSVHRAVMHTRDPWHEPKGVVESVPTSFWSGRGVCGELANVGPNGTWRSLLGQNNMFCIKSSRCPLLVRQRVAHGKQFRVNRSLVMNQGAESRTPYEIVVFPKRGAPSGASHPLARTRRRLEPQAFYSAKCRCFLRRGLLAHALPSFPFVSMPMRQQRFAADTVL